jgi:branched-chain amino acid transport system substrate-binding protein
LRKSHRRFASSTIALLIVACCALVAVPTGAPPASAASGPPIKIGVSLPLTGDNAATGQKALNGAKLAVNQINAKGGVLGRPMAVVEGDDQCDPKQSSNVAQKFASEKVIALASHYCSGAALAALPIVRESQMLYIDIAAVSSKLPAAGYDKYFTVMYNGSQPGQFTARLMKEKLGTKTVVVVDDKTPANTEFVDGFLATAQEQGGPQVLFRDHITQGDKDFSAFVTKLKGSNADAVYAVCYYPECGLLIRQMREQNLKTVFAGSDSLLDPAYVKIAGKDAAEGSLIITQPGADELPTAKQFVTEYKKSFPGSEPGNVGAYAYDAVLVIARAYTAAGKVDNDAAAKWLHGLTKTSAIQGSTGKLFWRPNGTITEFFFSTYRVHDGDFQFAKDLVLK